MEEKTPPSVSKQEQRTNLWEEFYDKPFMDEVEDGIAELVVGLNMILEKKIPMKFMRR